MLKLLTAADVTPQEFSDWYIFNTWLQKVTREHIHLHIPVTVEEVQAQVSAGEADLVYANPYDAAMLVRDYGFIPIVRPANQTDEMVIVTHKKNPISDFTALTPGCRIALTDDRDVKMIGMILIEPADLNADNVAFVHADNGVIVAKHVINGSADIGFIITKSYDHFSRLITHSLRELIRSEISVINHSLMVKPEVLKKVPNLAQVLTNMHTVPGGKKILDAFGMNGWLPVEQEEVEFMIDLMETLK